MNFQHMILQLQMYWSQRDCVIMQPYNSEVGAGTFNPATFLRVLDNNAWRTAFVETSKRPKDGRYGENPNRLQQFMQYQVIIQPAPDNIQDIYIDSLNHIGIETAKHDIRFVEDDWESPTLGAKGLGWEVWLDGMEITQFTYFQQMASMVMKTVPVEITYGLERIAMFMQGVDSVFDLKWSDSMTYRDVMLRSEKEHCVFNFEEADTEYFMSQFNKDESESQRLSAKGLVYPAYDYVIKAAHAFNILDARGAISPKERQNYIGRIRNMAKAAAKAYTEDNDNE